VILTRIPDVKDRPKVRIDVDDFSGGVNTLVSETRLDPKEAKEATNMMLDEDGIWKKRWGSADYGGVTFTNTIDGFTEYRKTDGTRELVVIADTKAYVVDPVAGTKTEISGATFTVGYRADFVQIKNYLYIVNGEDVMARYDGSVLTTYAGLAAVAWDGTPLTRGAGLSTGSYDYYYRVSAVNAVGETLAVAEATIDVDIIRDDWDEADEYTQLDWADVAGALKYVIYAGDTTGYLGKLTETTASTFQDDGSLSINYYVEPPTADTTTGPKFRSIAISENRIWGTNDPASPQRVHFTGTGVDMGNFSPAYGGGWVDLESGGRATCVKVVDYQDEAHVLTQTSEGSGAVWRIDLATVTIGSTDIIVPVPEKLVGAKGTPALRSVILVENDLYFFNSAGIHVLGDEVGVLNRLRTNELSANIRPYITDLVDDSLSKTCAYYYDSKAFFSVSTATGEPNKIIYYDREFKVWIKDWSIGVSQFGEFTDASGVSHFLGIRGNKLVEISANYEGDSSVAFSWQYISPRFSVDKDWSRFAKIDRAYVRLRSARGTPTITVTGTKRNGATTSLASDDIVQGSSGTGIGWDRVGTFKIGTTGGVPTFYAQEALIRYLVINELIRDIQWTISGNGLSDTVAITGIAAGGRLVGVASPEEWRLD